jgi:hypothetical protein
MAFTFLSYFFAFVLDLSPLFTMMITLLFINNYGFYNLDHQNQIFFEELLKLVSLIARGFLFFNIGISIAFK